MRGHLELGNQTFTLFTCGPSASRAGCGNTIWYRGVPNTAPGSVYRAYIPRYTSKVCTPEVCTLAEYTSVVYTRGVQKGSLRNDGGVCRMLN